MAVSRFLIAPIAATRSVLALNGAEAPKFLQGLVSSDIQSSTPANPVYAGFFSAQGRVLYDTFILPSSSLSGDHPHFLVDHSRAVNSTIPSLLAYIKRYILRSKVRVKNADDEYRLWAVFRHPLHVSNEAADTAVEQELEQLASSGRGHWWRDKRSAQLGYRLLLPPSSSSSVESEDNSFPDTLLAQANVETCSLSLVLPVLAPNIPHASTSTQQCPRGLFRPRAQSSPSARKQHGHYGWQYVLTLMKRHSCQGW